jgi:release factor glutamine methyltransferase
VDAVVTVRDALAERQIGRRDAETLLLHVLNRDRAWLFGHPETELGTAELERFRTLARRRAAFEPLQHLTGQQEFYGLLLRVTRDTLIPRPETELLVEAVLQWAEEQAGPLRIVDVGTGTGAIALALAKHLQGAEIVAVDISAEALAVARGNARRLGLSVRFLESDLLGALTREPVFDVVVSNPPYVASTDASSLQPEVVDHEPHIALFGGEDGLDIYRRLLPQVQDALRPGGLLAVEFGFGQRRDVAELFQGWDDLRILEDYAGIARVALATRPTRR